MTDKLDAFDRHGGIHEDQYRTSKQSRRDARREIDEALEDMRADELEYVKHCMGIGPEFEHDMLTQSLQDEFQSMEMPERYDSAMTLEDLWPEGEYS